jgi:hypothetical protein
VWSRLVDGDVREAFLCQCERGGETAHSWVSRVSRASFKTGWKGGVCVTCSCDYDVEVFVHLDGCESCLTSDVVCIKRDESRKRKVYSGRWTKSLWKLERNQIISIGFLPVTYIPTMKFWQLLAWNHNERQWWPLGKMGR